MQSRRALPTTLDVDPVGRGSRRTRAQDEHGFATVGPTVEGQHGFIGLAADDDRIHAGEERLVAMRLAATGWQKIEFTTGTRDESIEAGADENGCLHDRPPVVTGTLYGGRPAGHRTGYRSGVRAAIVRRPR